MGMINMWLVHCLFLQNINSYYILQAVLIRVTTCLENVENVRELRELTKRPKCREKSCQGKLVNCCGPCIACLRILLLIKPLWTVFWNMQWHLECHGSTVCSICRKFCSCSGSVRENCLLLTSSLGLHQCVYCCRPPLSTVLRIFLLIKSLWAYLHWHFWCIVSTDW